MTTNPDANEEPVVTFLDAELPTVQMLLKRFANSIKGERGARQLFTDSPSAALMFESLGQSQSGQQGAGISELDLICDALKSFEPIPNEVDRDRKTLEQARNFFITLSKRSAAYAYGGLLNPMPEFS